MKSLVVFYNQMSLGVFDTQLGAQGMEGLFELQHSLALLMRRGPSNVLVIIVSNRVILLLEHIHTKLPSVFGPKCSKILCEFFLLVSFPPMFDMGDSLKECKGDLFPV